MVARQEPGTIIAIFVLVIIIIIIVALIIAFLSSREQNIEPRKRYVYSSIPV